ncbi:DNA-binding transcriptional activator of the SARP family [Actinacidiphila yanglinensis]|uniref:DNA-binding transcriptional activator of the SARP family n=1 Tax=Actinacidiphila yanglinensis TaxID=310779 RepID=A0A1H6AKV6_9ACTN|nr:BTAD domain-containing putative transcriptional regulator [Actinacidiphila yanglinensis]SEG49181.1 DNA-binding transcriptional activator of the SARP family [Actinacidiphila yanglinensis]
MQILVLGLLELRHEGRAVVPTAGRDRALLVELIVHRGNVVSTGHLAEVLWGADQPTDPANALQVRVSRLRALLRSVAGPAGASLLHTRPGGYQFTPAEPELDVLAYEAALTAASQAAADEDRAAALMLHERAAALWRGEPFGGMPVGGCAAAESARLDELHLTACEDRAAAALRARRPADVLAALGAQVAAHPLRERAHALLIAALRDLGRPAEALAAYGRLRTVLAEELGTEPSPELRALHLDLLRVTAAPAPAPPRRPAQLPPKTVSLVGRSDERAVLDDALTRDMPAGASTVVVVSGMGGVGKTVLALSAAHELSERFPDGQLFVRLHGATPGLEAVAPAGALDTLIRSLGDAPPPGEGAEAAAAHLRSLLAGRRILLVLDDALSAAQVRPLLPAGPGCAVIVTSRVRLAGIEHAVHVPLGPLAEEDCVALLGSVAGRDRIAAEPAAAAQLAELCGGLPLALRISASRLSARTAWSVSSLVERLTGHRERLDELDLDDLSVRGTLSVTYQALTRGTGSEERMAAEVFRGIGTLDLPHYSAPVVAVLLDVTEHQAGRALDRLVDVALLEETHLGRYAPHDLVRDVCRELAQQETDREGRSVAVARVLEWYAAMAGGAARALLPSRHRGLVFLAPGNGVRVPVDATRAAAWSEVERTNVLALLGRTFPGPRAHPVVIQLGMAACACLQRQGRFAELLAAGGIVAATATAAGDTPARGAAWNYMAAAHWGAGRHGESLALIDDCLDLWRACGDTDAERGELCNRGLLLDKLDRLEEARVTLLDCLRLCEESGDRYNEAITLSHLGNLHDRIDARLSIGFHQRSLRLGEELEHAVFMDTARCNIGYALLALDRPGEAQLHFEAALELLDVDGQWTTEREIRLGLSRALREQGAHQRAARECAVLLELSGSRDDTYSLKLARAEAAVIDELLAAEPATT